MDIFIHVPKTGGSTLRVILAREYGVKNILYYEPHGPSWPANQTPEQFIASQLAQRPISLVTGHHQYGVHKLLGTNSHRYFTILRDPIDRAVSNYFYAYQFDGHLQGREIRTAQLGLDEFISNPAYSCPYAQAHLLSGVPSFGKGHSGTALDNLKTNFAAVGITERFDVSVLQIAKSLNWKPPFYLTRNASQIDLANVEHYQATIDALRTKLKDLYSEDYSVYALAQQIMEKRILAEGRLFSAALSSFEEIQKDISIQNKNSVHLPYNFEADFPLPEIDRYKDSEPYKDIMAYLNTPSPEATGS